jgi:ABC-type glycerol-3-phosphate transport system substrate-binding protein
MMLSIGLKALSGGKTDVRECMPTSVYIDHEQFIVRTTASGMVTIEDAFAVMAQVNDDPEYRKGMGTLLDLRNTQVMVKMDQLTTLAEAIKKLTPIRGKVGIAILTDSDLTFGMGRMVGSSLGDDDVKVAAFRDEDEAVAWLHEVSEGSGYYRRKRPTSEEESDAFEPSA